METSDYLVVGGGTAGCVLANRLSADPRCRVTIVEAGADVVPGHEPYDIRCVFPLSVFNPRYAWPDTRVHWRDAHQGPSSPMPQGRILGGTSNIMGMWAMRGKPDVYDAWEADGAEGWGWAGVLPYFRKLENDLDFGGPLHGTDGPVPIRRALPQNWSPLARAFHQAALQEGYREVEDMNAEFDDGHCTLPVSRHENARASAGLCYMGTAVRARANLRVMTGITARHLLFDAQADGPKVVGIEATDVNGRTLRLHAQQVILAAGALRSPELLLRSGIGPGERLQAAGVPVRRHLGGVGANLQNHPLLFMVSFLASQALESPGWRPAGNNYLRWSSGLPGMPAGDMGMSVRSWLSWHALGRRMGAVAPTVSMPFSRGRVSLGAGPNDSVSIEFKLLDDPRDLARMVRGLRLAGALYGRMRAIAGEPQVLLDVANISRLMRYNEPTRLNALRARAAAGLLDLMPTLGRRWVSGLAQMTPAARILDDEDKLARFALRSVSGTGHICGTCRMGREGDPYAVTDAQGKVFGVGGLRVADASVMPRVPSGGTHIPAIMVAEKMADAIRTER
jgi:5-(hydroxymethyl)furfural/furfural oxidase